MKASRRTRPARIRSATPPTPVRRAKSKRRTATGGGRGRETPGVRTPQCPLSRSERVRGAAGSPPRRTSSGSLSTAHFEIAQLPQLLQGGVLFALALYVCLVGREDGDRGFDGLRLRDAREHRPDGGRLVTLGLCDGPIRSFGVAWRSQRGELVADTGQRGGEAFKLRGQGCGGLCRRGRVESVFLLGITFLLGDRGKSWAVYAWREPRAGAARLGLGARDRGRTRDRHRDPDAGRRFQHLRLRTSEAGRQGGYGHDQADAEDGQQRPTLLRTSQLGKHVAGVEHDRTPFVEVRPTIALATESGVSRA